MRITGGRFRSRQLRGPTRGMPLRPTPDALRERAFAVLGGRLEGCRFLDLYAGTGAIGCEALSRGALEVVFVEHHRAAAGIIRANCAALGLSADQGRVLVSPVRRALALLARSQERFDLAWADPPFAHWADGLSSLADAFARSLLPADAVACLECPDHAELSALPAHLRILRELKGGASRVVILSTLGNE